MPGFPNGSEQAVNAQSISAFGVCDVVTGRPGAYNGAHGVRFAAAVLASSRVQAPGSLAISSAISLPGANQTSSMFGASVQQIAPPTPTGSNADISPRSSEARWYSSLPTFEDSAQSTEAILQQQQCGASQRYGTGCRYRASATARTGCAEQLVLMIPSGT